MERYGRGYTLLEVLIVLAISTLLFISSFVVFIGKQRQTEFSQAMEDLSSKIQSYVAQINSGTFLDIEGYKCTLNSSNKPVLTAASGNIGTNEDCIALGKAFHVVPGPSNDGKVYVYTVLGSRNQAGGALAATISQANPSPAVQNGDENNWLLVEEYVLQRGAKVLSSSVGISGNNYTMVGIYNSLQGDAPSSGGAATSTVMRAYSNPAGPRSLTAKGCIQELSGCGGIITASDWTICIASSDGDRTAELVVSARPAGITTQINDRVCS